MTADIASPPDGTTNAVMKLKQELESLPHTQRLTNADAEAVYALAYREYTQARYEEALRYFQVLLVYRPTHKVYLLGAALCLQRVHRYDLAIAAYGALSLLDPQQPSHTLAMAECQLLCREYAPARETLAQVIDSCRENPGHDRVHARADAMLDLMKSQDEAHHESTAA